MSSHPRFNSLRRVALGCALAWLTTGTLAQSVVRISGTGSGTGGMRLLAQAFMQANPAVRVDVLPAVGSSGGISALIAGQVELAVSNRPPKPAEIDKLAMLSVEYARTPFVVAVHRDLGVSALTLAQFAALFAEGAATFPNGKRARPVLRMSDTVDMAILKSLSPAVTIAIDAATQRRGMLNADTDSEAADLVERTAGAFAGSTLALIESEKRPLIALTIDGKAPTVAALVDGSYPYFKALFMIVGPQAGAETKRFAAYLQSASGRALLRAHGHAPL